MEFLNAVITNITVGMKENYLTVNVSFKTNKGNYEWNRRLTDSNCASCLERLMRYATANTFDEMEGKIVRIVVHNNSLYGFGDPIIDGFVPLFIDKGAMQLTPTTFTDWLNDYLKNN